MIEMYSPQNADSVTPQSRSDQLQRIMLSPVVTVTVLFGLTLLLSSLVVNYAQQTSMFPLNSFTIMLFHYDGIVDQWQDLGWSNLSIHVVALHQTKWWYAKRFMHPDIVEQYDYIFLWDEDLGVEHFHAERYLEIMKAEGLEISQPALDPESVEIHHKITRRHPHLTVHRSIVTPSCPPHNKAVPCTGFVEVMAPVFTRAAWQCVWHMIQNDLVHSWGIDFKLGYRAQGLRSKKV